MEIGSRQSLRQPDDEVVRRVEELAFDLGHLDENLALSPLERMRQHDEAVRRILAARKRLGVAEDEEA